MCKIKVVDSIMGSGKTSGAIQMMNNNPKQNYIYITPFLSEVQRIKDNCKGRKFYEPKSLGHGKLDSLHRMIMQKRNIASTHALFMNSNQTTIDLLEANDYVLVLDEVVNVVNGLPLLDNDLEILKNEKLIIIEEKTCKVKWNEEKLHYDTQYNYIKDMCLQEVLFYLNDKLFIWTFPAKVFKAFKEVYVLTYLFDAQIQRYYYDLFNIEYEYYYSKLDIQDNKYKIYNNNFTKEEQLQNNKFEREKLKNLIDILKEDKINSIGDKKHSLSVKWYENNEMLVKQLKKNIDNYFKNKIKGKSKENMWTTFKDYKSKLSSGGYSRGFVSSNARATNDYVQCKNLAYCINKFLKPDIIHFFRLHNVRVEEDLFALSELLQWIWRSQIRKGEPINLYIPSNRMRTLLIKWLEGEI